MLGAGLVVQVVNFDVLAVLGGALKEVVAADVSFAEAAVAVVFALVAMLIPYWAPALAFAVAPRRAAPMLGRMSRWILGHSRPLEIWVGLLFGVTFLAKGIRTLA